MFLAHPKDLHDSTFFLMVILNAGTMSSSRAKTSTKTRMSSSCMTLDGKHPSKAETIATMIHVNLSTPPLVSSFFFL